MRLPLLAAILTVSACVTVTGDGSKPPRAEANLLEAARINTELGIDFMRKGQYDAALEKLTRALDQNPDYALAHSSVAFVYSQRGEYGRADKSYKRALQLAPDDPATRNNFGVFLCGQNRRQDAEGVFLQAARNPRYAEPEKAWTNAGVCARGKPDLDKAEQFFREALKARAEFPEALAQLAGMSLERKDYLRARAFVQRYERVGPATPETLWIAAKAEFALGDEAAAAAYAARLRREFPESKESASLQSPPSS